MVLTSKYTIITIIISLLACYAFFSRLVEFYGISTFLGYLMPNPVYIYNSLTNSL